MEKLLEMLVNSGFIAIIIPFLTQFYKKKRHYPSDEEVRLFFIFLCFLFAILGYFLEKNTELLNVFIKIISGASATYYVIKGFLDFNNKNTIL